MAVLIPPRPVPVAPPAVPPAATAPLLHYPSQEQPWALKRDVAESLQKLRDDLNGIFEKLRKVSTLEPKTVEEIIDRQNAIVENLNKLVGDDTP